MSHPNSPEYWTITNIDPHDGTHYLIGIFTDLDAVYYRMKQMYLQCGSELRIECHRLIDAEEEAVDYNKLMVSRAKYKREEEEKEAKLKELEKKEQEDFDKMMSFDEWEKMEDNRIERDKMMNEDFMEDLIKEAELT